MKSSYKKMIAGCIALLVVLAASGCGAGESEPVLDDVEAKQGDVVSDMADSPGALMEKPKETEPKEAAQMDASAYGEILERFYTIISNPYEDYDDVPGEMGVSEVAKNTGGQCAGCHRIHHQRYQRRWRSGIDDRHPAGVRPNGECSLHAGGRQAPIRL